MNNKEKLEQYKIALNEISREYVVTYWENKQPNEYCTQEEIAQKLKIAKENLTKELDEIKDIDDFMEYVGESERYLIEAIDSYGGEGQGEEMWYVNKLTDKANGNSFFIRFNFYYDSWNGSDYQGCEIVEEREVMVKRYFAVGD